MIFIHVDATIAESPPIVPDIVFAFLVNPYTPFLIFIYLYYLNDLHYLAQDNGGQEALHCAH